MACAQSKENSILVNEPNTQLCEHLRARILTDGPLSIADYMHECLYHPQLGYYNTRAPIGAAGDFVTAPEISQMFGEMIGVWLNDLWQRMGRPTKAYMLELGPGRGTLMQDLLRSIDPNFKQALSVHMLEISPVLRDLQQNQLKGEKITWHTELEEALNACQDAPILVVANEFFDALPIHQLIKREKGWVEQWVQWHDQENRFCFTEGPVTKDIMEENMPAVENGTIVELSPCSQKLMQQLAQQIVQQGGAMLTIDYGFQENATGSTFQAVSKHKYHDPLSHVGQIDLTAHVNFPALGRSARKQGAQVWGPAPQGIFLSELGIQIRGQQLQRKASPNQKAELERSLHRLTSPTQMGTLFKVMAVTAPNTPIPVGFATCLPATT